MRMNKSAQPCMCVCVRVQCASWCGFHSFSGVQQQKQYTIHSFFRPSISLFTPGRCCPSVLLVLLLLQLFSQKKIFHFPLRCVSRSVSFMLDFVPLVFWQSTESNSNSAINVLSSAGILWIRLMWKIYSVSSHSLFAEAWNRHGRYRRFYMNHVGVIATIAIIIYLFVVVFLLQI